LIWIAGGAVSAAIYGLSPAIVAASTESSGFGVLNHLGLPFGIRFFLAFLLLDLTRYAIHWGWHAVPLFWRVHQVHHSDPDLDLSTAFRVHPVELIATHGAYLIMTALIGPPVAAALFFELSRVFLNFFAHANATLPAWIEKPARAIFITPDLHRIHHSEEEQEQGKNLGETFSWWDRLFRTYVPEPRAGQAAMNTGLRGYQSKASLSFKFILELPFLPSRNSESTASTATTE
jgi:sterol desaturase/sphingolipid hydroxylase (fatty acid hydroxylase superfamily)